MTTLFIIKDVEILTEKFAIAFISDCYDVKENIYSSAALPEPSHQAIDFENNSDEWTFEYGERFMLCLAGQRDDINPIFEVVKGQDTINHRAFKAVRMVARQR